MLGLGLAPVFAVYLLLNLLIGITSPCYNTPITVTIQERVQQLLLAAGALVILLTVCMAAFRRFDRAD